MSKKKPQRAGKEPSRAAAASPPAATSAKPAAAPAKQAAVAPAALTLAVYTLTTFLSAMLLFSVQPLFAKMVLPILGGAPSVWAVALLFFQGALLAGYCYAHFLIAKVPAAKTGLVHLGLCALAFLSLPIGLPASWGEPPQSEPYMWQLGLFTVAIGLPFVAVSANAPLLQAWFARSGHPQANEPYFLYAASNLGSLIALLSFPFVLEPVFGLSSLARIWTAGFAILAAMIGLCFYLVRSAAGAPLDAKQVYEQRLRERKRGSGPSLQDRLGWVGLALVPSALLTAFTTHVATDVASAPLMWVIPLALYLSTFVIVFRETALIPSRYLLAFHVLAVTAALIHLSQIKNEGWMLSSVVGVAAFTSAALVAHRTLYEARPDASQLTEFYLWMSAGGALGGLFAALIAPKMFPEVFEYPLLLALSMACRPGALGFLKGKGRDWAWVGGIVAAAALVMWAVPLLVAWEDTEFRGWGATTAITLVLGAAMLVFWRQPSRQLVTALAMCVAVILLPSYVHRGDAQRSYFGVYRVVRSLDGQYNVLQHGTTFHGAQRMRDENGNPVVDFAPKAYYYPKSPMAQSVNIARANIPAEAGPGRYAVIGLGAGALGCLAKPEESWRFFEIDPIVLEIAQSKDFTYLANCQPKPDVAIGDARLTLAKEKDQSFDYLLVDAFSSDAVPVHLMTAESLALYAAKLKPSGLGVLHISNRYLDLEAVLKETVPLVPGLKAFILEDPKPNLGYDVTGSIVVAFSKDLEVAHRFLRLRGGRTLNGPGLRPWTDDASDILGPFMSRYRQGG